MAALKQVNINFMGIELKGVKVKNVKEENNELSFELDTDDLAEKYKQELRKVGLSS